MTTAGDPSESNWEKDFLEGVDHLPQGRFRVDQEPRGVSPLRPKQSYTSVSMPPEVFEKLCLTQQPEVKGDYHKTWANPTPLALLGFIMACTPLACDLMGWRGAGNHGLALTASYYYMGGLLMFFSGVLEFFLGNTFAFVVFCSFGGFWFTFSATLQPVLNTIGYRVPDASSPESGLDDPTFQASFGFYLLFMAVLCFIYLICALRTNICFVLIFFGLFMEFILETAQYWHLSQGNAELAAQMQTIAGAFSFLACISGWYIFFAQMLEALDYIIVLPVGDLSGLIKGASQRKKEAADHAV